MHSKIGLQPFSRVLENSVVISVGLGRSQRLLPTPPYFLASGPEQRFQLHPSFFLFSFQQFLMLTVNDAEINYIEILEILYVLLNLSF